MPRRCELFQQGGPASFRSAVRVAMAPRIDERRSQQLLDGSDTFRDEQALPLAGFSAAEVAGEGKKSCHWECVLPLR